VDLLGFVAGAAVSIPVAVYAPFLTDKIKQKRGERNRAESKKRRAQLEKERTQVNDWINDPHSFTRYLLGRILGITLTTAFITLAVGIITTFAQGYILYVDSTHPDQALLPEVLTAIETIPSFLGIIGTAVVIQLCVRTLRALKRVNTHEHYLARVDDQLASLKEESAP
jgi:hypothetical protein